MGDLLDRYGSWLRAQGTAAGTVRLRLHYLSRLADFHDGRDLLALTLDDLVDFMCANSWAPETRKSARAALRGFYQWATDTDRVARNPARLLPPVKVPAGHPRPAPEVIVDRALRHAKPQDLLMIMLAAYAGLRRAEISRVHTRDIIGTDLRVVGKGGRVRHVPLHPDLHQALLLVDEGWVFGIDGRPMTPDAVGKRLRRALGDGWSAHTLRHRFATRAYSAERDIRAVQTLLGHSKPETTARYTAVPDGALRTAVMAAGDAA